MSQKCFLTLCLSIVKILYDIIVTVCVIEKIEGPFEDYDLSLNVSRQLLAIYGCQASAD